MYHWTLDKKIASAFCFEVNKSWDIFFKKIEVLANQFDFTEIVKHIHL